MHIWRDLLPFLCLNSISTLQQYGLATVKNLLDRHNKKIIDKRPTNYYVLRKVLRDSIETVEIFDDIEENLRTDYGMKYVEIGTGIVVFFSVIKQNNNFRLK